MNFVNQLAQILTHHFGILWLAGMVGIFVVSIGMYRTGWTYGWQGTVAEPAPKAGRPAALAMALFIIFLLAYFIFMFWNEDFTYEDGHNFTGFSAIGVTRPSSVWIDVGRFWPLGYLEYNLISHLSKTATAYLVFGAVQLIIVLWILYKAMPERSTAFRLGALVLLLLSPAFAVNFAELTYADRNVCFAICLLIVCVTRYDRRPSLVWLIPSLVVGYCALYYKEMTAALIGSFAGIRILLKASRSGWRNALRSPLEIGLILGVACFAIQLALVLLPTGTSAYINHGFVGRGTAAFRYLMIDPLVAVFLVAFVIHAVQVLRRGGKFDPFWDALAFGGLMHFCAVSVTGVVEDYLFGPTELVAILTLMRLVPSWWAGHPNLRPILGAILGVAAVVSVAFCTYRLVYRKAVVIETQRVTDFLISYYHTPGNGNPRLYFRGDYGLVVNFASYLHFRGLRVRSTGDAPQDNAIDFAGSEPYADNLCAYYDVFVCRTDIMRTGDLVVRLPEEGTWMWRTFTPPPSLPSGTRLQPIYQALPANTVPSLRPVLATLHWASPNFYGVFLHQPLTDEWGSASVGQIVASQ